MSPSGPWPRHALRAAALVKARTVVPTHLGTYPVLTGTTQDLEQALAGGGTKAAVIVMQPGETRAC